MTPYYADKWCQLFRGDCREILPHLPKVDLVLTDVPYGEVSRKSSGLRSLDKGQADIKTLSDSETIRLIEASFSGSAYIWCGTEQVSEFRRYLEERDLSTRLCIWEKTNASPMNGQHLWISAIECCVFGKRNGAAFNEHCKPPVFRGPVAEQNGHPTPKPEWLFSRLIEASSNRGDLIGDWFSGSGTALACAKKLGRKSIGIELDEEFAEIAARRLEAENTLWDNLSPPKPQDSQASLFEK